MNVYGIYNLRGYTVYSEKGEPLYVAGNSPFDSTQDVTGLACALSLDEIRRCCIASAAMLAEENGGKVLYIEESEDWITSNF